MSSKKIVIIDYGMGNLRSVYKSVSKYHPNVLISDNKDVISSADKLILPGVGHFANGIKNLKDSKIIDVLNQKVLVDKTPILGICLGMQLMAKHSTEGYVDGLGWFDAEVIKFNVKDKLRYKVPHIAWNTVSNEKESLLFKDIPNNVQYYFVHSYFIKCNNVEDSLTTTDYEEKFTSSIERNNIFGTQFHPEKSHDWGKKLISNFVNI